MLGWSRRVFSSGYVRGFERRWANWFGQWASVYFWFCHEAIAFERHIQRGGISPPPLDLEANEVFAPFRLPEILGITLLDPHEIQILT